MNGIQLNGKPRRCDKPVPGCLGRMVNLFDLTSSGNRLLTDKPHNDGSSLSRSRSDVSRMSYILGEEMQDKMMISELRRSSSSKKPNGTPVKMLMAQEMSKDLESKQNAPNVVAKLMGLDALPQQQPDLAIRRSHSQCYTRNNHSEEPIGYWKEEHGFHSKQIDCEIHPNRAKSEDIFEIWKPSQRTNCIRDESSPKGRSNEIVNDKKLALIRQKFMEAKRLATDEKLRQTKEFQDALDVLSSNGDLFLKVLQEPNSFSQHLYDGQSIPSPPETKRITVLRPSKMMVDDKFAGPTRRNEEQRRKQVQVNHVNLWDTHNGFSPTMSTWKADDSPTQPTRIVVLKPSAMKGNDGKTVISSTPSSPRTLPGERFCEETEDEDAREAREVAREITQQMRENLGGHRRDETLLSSVFSNGYTGDESSFDKSDKEFAPGNLSDSEVMSPTSRHSWDYLNRYGSPYSVSSFSRASCSPESSVCREAKKRLSERWAMMASNGSYQEQRRFRKNSSTLGEMLALADMKKPEILEEEDNNKELNPRGSTSCLNSDVGSKEGGNDSPRNLLRSKSVPVSSSYGERLNVEASDAVLCKDGSRGLLKTKASKSSFTGKVTSLFFSRSKKTRKDKSGKAQFNDESPLSTPETPGTSNNHSEAVLSPPSQPQSGTIMEGLIDKRLGHGISSHQGGYCVSQSTMLGIQGENQDQPSPVSVLEPPFEEDESATLGCSSSIEPNPYGNQMPLCIGKSNLIDKSPPIGSIARTLSWDESSAATTTSYPLNSPFASPRAEDDEGEMLFLVQSLLSMAGLVDVEQLTTNMSKWHSPISPLDPLVKDKYFDLTAKEPLTEAKRRQLRSSRKLIFDCVNAALVDMSGIGTTASQWGRGRVGVHKRLLDHGPRALSGKVWAWMKEWYAGQVKFLSLDDGDSDSLVERVVVDEVVGKGWGQQMGLEIDNVGQEIEGKLLEQLIEESLIELTGRYC